MRYHTPQLASSYSEITRQQRQLANEGVALAVEKGAAFWKAFRMLNQGLTFALTGKTSDAIEMLTSGIKTAQPTGATPRRGLPDLARAYA